jgi:hypothetical protein
VSPSGQPDGPHGGFSDGVFGFAATLLVLDLALRPPGTPPQQLLLHAWPGYLAYVVSFLAIGGAWLLHTALTDQLAPADSLFLRLSLLVLLVVVFLPFPTRLAAKAHSTITPAGREPGPDVAARGLSEVLVTIISISLGVLVGASAHRAADAGIRRLTRSPGSGRVVRGHGLRG